MTDISQWVDFIEKVNKKFTLNGWGQTVKEYSDSRWVVPLSEYQLANMLWMFTEMMKQNDEGYKSGKNYMSWNSGDWFYEVISILTECWVKMGLKTIQANSCPYQYDIDELKDVGWNLLRYDKKKMDELCVKCKGWKKEEGSDICSLCRKHG